MPIAALQAFAKTQTDTSAYFKTLKSYIQLYKLHLQTKDVSLNWTEAIEQRKKDRIVYRDAANFNNNKANPPFYRNKPFF